MSFLGNVFDYELFNGKNFLKNAGNHPDQLLLGAADPFSASMWSKITGKDYKPFVGVFGGSTADTNRKAEEAGIDTKNGRQVQHIADALSAYGAAGYGLGAAGAFGSGAGGASGAAGSTGAASTPSTGGFAGAWNSFNSYAKPISQGVGYAQQAQGLLGGQQQPMQQAQLPQYQDMSGILSTAQNPQLAQLQAQRAKRRGLLGGNYG